MLGFIDQDQWLENRPSGYGFQREKEHLLVWPAESSQLNQDQPEAISKTHKQWLPFLPFIKAAS
jgi:hypothetical protein